MRVCALEATCLVQLYVLSNHLFIIKGPFYHYCVYLMACLSLKVLVAPMFNELRDARDG